MGQTTGTWVQFDRAAYEAVRAFRQIQPTEADITRFIALFTPLVERPVRKILGRSNGDVEQAVVDTFFRLWQKRANVPSDETAVFYVLRVAHNIAVDACRAQKRSISAVPLLPEEAQTQPREDASMPQGGMELQELFTVLDARTKAIFLQYYYEGYSAHEIAAHHKIKLPTVYTKLRRAKILLRKQAAKEKGRDL